MGVRSVAQDDAVVLWPNCGALAYVHVRMNVSSSWV